MRKKMLSLALLWLLLIAMVWLYTDRDAYTWHMADAFVMTEEEAQQAAYDAAVAMAQERKAAQERGAAGIWGKEDEYDGAPATRPAQEQDAPGLNLMWGDYTVTLTYVSDAALPVRVVCIGRQSFIEGGEMTLPAAPQGGQVTIPFTLTDSAEQVRMAATLPEGAYIEAITVHKVGAGVFSPDLAAYAAVVGAVLTLLLVLSWDDSARGRARRRDAMTLICACVFSCMPLLWRGIYDGHDLTFHLNRIEGIASGLRCGQFPVRIHASTLLGYGYASSIFYPELFLYFPAMLRNLGVSLVACLRVLEMGITLATAFVCYVSTHRLFGERRTALGASVLYTLCLYRLVNLYTRATLGESLAMIFFPLVIYAMVEVVRRDARHWPLLALAMTGIAMSHLLSTLFAALLCAVGALLGVKRLLREPRRILALCKAAGVTALCVMWFYVPMLRYSADGVSTSVVLDAAANVHQLGSYLVGFPGKAGSPDALEDFAYSIGVIPGLAIMVGCALLLMRRYADGRAALGGEDGRRTRLATALLWVGALTLLCATDFFPWELACGLRRPFSTLFMQMQFPWRLVSVAAPMLCMAAAWGYLGQERHASAGLAALLVLSVLGAGYTLQGMVQTVPVLEPEGFCDTRIGQYEYTYPSTEKSALEPGRVHVSGAYDNKVTAFAKHGTNLTLTVELPEGCDYVEVPLLYYPGYRATCNGEACEVQRGENNVIRLLTNDDQPTRTYRVWFAPPQLWIVMQAVSLAGALLLGASLLRMRKRAGR